MNCGLRKRRLAMNIVLRSINKTQIAARITGNRVNASSTAGLRLDDCELSTKLSTFLVEIA